MPINLTAEKLTAAVDLAGILGGGRRVCLTTHVNPDGDGLGSEVGLAHLLRANGVTVSIANPTPTAPRFEFLFRDLPGVDRSDQAVKELRRAASEPRSFGERIASQRRPPQTPRIFASSAATTAATARPTKYLPCPAMPLRAIRPA